MIRALQFFKKYRWALLSGLMMGTTYIPLPPWALAFCWAPLWWDLFKNTRSLKEAFCKGWWTQFLLTLIGFHWISFVSHEFGFLPKPVALGVLILFAALAHLYIPVATALAWWLGKKYSWSLGIFVVAIACLQNLGEAFWPSIFSWNLGYPLLFVQSPLAQWADVIGFLGLSFIAHLVNALVTWMLPHWREPRAWALTSLAVLTLGLGAFLGSERGEKWRNRPGSEKVRASIIQGNIGNLEKIYAERGAGYQREILEKYFSLSYQALAQDPRIDLLIWPESAMPEFLDMHNTERKYARLFFENLRNLRKSLITGAFSNDPPGPPPRDDYNALFGFDENGAFLSEPYHKTHLLIFGEYVPLGKIFPILRKWNPGGEGFGAGSGAAHLMPWHGFQIGPQLCYDSLYPHFSRQLSLAGADFLINLTNDSWFGPSFEPEQHLYMTLARALEVRRPLLRSTNTGITTAIQASGDILQQSPLGIEWFSTFEISVQKNAEQTFYTRFGFFLSLLPLALLLFLIGIGIRGTSRLE